MPKGIRKLHIAVGEYNLTHFGGIPLIHAFCKNLRLRWLLQAYVQFPQRSSRYHPIDIILTIIYAIIVGIYRLSKTKILQGNSSFQRIIGLKSFPYASSLRRCLKRVDHKAIQGINKVHNHLRLKMFYFNPRTSLLFDLDSSILTIYGKFIEEAKKGYNPHKRGRRSYHPLLCFESHTKSFWHGVLRPGDAYTAAGSVEFWEECLAKMPPYIYRIRLRADSGFFDHKFIEPLDEKSIDYAIVAKLTPAIKRQLEGLCYHSFKKGWVAAEFCYKPWKWKNSHRFVVIRRPLPEKDSEQLTLFTMTRYAYRVFVSNLPLKPQNVWYFYRGRAGIELIIKELKEDYTLANIPTNNFRANQTYFYLLLFAYNIVNWFKTTCLPTQFQSATLETIRAKFLLLPARLVKTDNRNVLKIPAPYISKQTLEQIMHKIEKIRELQFCTLLNL